LNVVFVRASLRGFRRHPRSGVRLAVLAALVMFLLFRTRPEVDPRVVGLVALGLAALCLFIPTAIHEAHGRWQLRPACWEDEGQWRLAISPRWAEPASCECVVADPLGRSWVHDLEQHTGRIVLRFPEGFRRADEVHADPAPSTGRHLVRWTVKQAGNTFDATSEFAVGSASGLTRGERGG
jgi:hypothetical protein